MITPIITNNKQEHLTLEAQVDELCCNIHSLATSTGLEAIEQGGENENEP